MYLFSSKRSRSRSKADPRSLSSEDDVDELELVPARPLKHRSSKPSQSSRPDTHSKRSSRSKRPAAGACPALRERARAAFDQIRQLSLQRAGLYLLLLLALFYVSEFFSIFESTPSTSTSIPDMEKKLHWGESDAAFAEDGLPDLPKPGSGTHGDPAAHQTSWTKHYIDDGNASSVSVNSDVEELRLAKAAGDDKAGEDLVRAQDIEGTEREEMSAPGGAAAPPPSLPAGTAASRTEAEKQAANLEAMKFLEERTAARRAARAMAAGSRVDPPEQPAAPPAAPVDAPPAAPPAAPLAVPPAAPPPAPPPAPPAAAAPPAAPVADGKDPWMSYSKTADLEKSTGEASAKTVEQKAEKPTSFVVPNSDLELSPFNWNMVDLMVPEKEGKMERDEVRAALRNLAKAYLKPFEKGIHRMDLFEVLKRKTYGLTPDGGNKGIQSMLVQIINNRVYLMDPYNVPKNSKPFYRGRINEMIVMLSELADEKVLPDTEFLVAIHDCVQTVSKQHPYRVAKYVESKPVFTIVGCNFSDNIPIPMWEGDDERGGGYKSWERKMKGYQEDKWPWSEKKSQAVFRGGIRQSNYFGDKESAKQNCDQAGRTKLAELAKEHADMLDVSVGGSCKDKKYKLQKLTPNQHHEYKYVLYAEGNCFWADRINRQVFGPSTIMKQITPCGQYFEPLLRPFTHFVPVDFFFNDVEKQVTWLRDNDERAQEIVKNANRFGEAFLSVNGIFAYVELLLDEYTKLLTKKEITIEPGAVDVTHKKV